MLARAADGSLAERYRAVIAYDGTPYCGFQRQAGDTPTVQGTIESALARVTQQPITVLGAGRTDTGVHAAGQVIAFDAEWRHTPHDLWRALNANLPDTIAVRSLDEAPRGFHPRYDARSRTYEYTLYVAPVRHPLLGRYAWHVPASAPLDLQAMGRAAGSLIGVHDFATFGQPTHGESTTREVMRSEFAIVTNTISREQVIRYTIEGNAFLYRMVQAGCGRAGPGGSRGCIA